MLTEKEIQTRIAEILTDGGFLVIASEVEEGFKKPAVFVTVYPASAEKLTCGGATEQITDTVEIKYVSGVETVEDCIDAAHKIKRLFYYSTFSIQDRHLTIQEIEFEVEKTTLYVYFDLSFIQAVDSDEEFETIETLEIGGGI